MKQERIDFITFDSQIDDSPTNILMKHQIWGTLARITSGPENRERKKEKKFK